MKDIKFPSSVHPRSEGSVQIHSHVALCEVSMRKRVQHFEHFVCGLHSSGCQYCVWQPDCLPVPAPCVSAGRVEFYHSRHVSQKGKDMEKLQSKRLFK